VIDGLIFLSDLVSLSANRIDQTGKWKTEKLKNSRYLPGLFAKRPL
jgi:hypothetical protein